MLQTMIHICENDYPDFFQLDQVTGLAIGHKIKGGIDTGIPSLHVFVTKKLPPDQVVAGHLIPTSYKGIPTDVIESGVIEAYSNTTKIRPAVGGISIAPLNATYAGTLGCLVSTASGSSLTIYILSNNHVLANSNAEPIGTLILQPAPGDGGNLSGNGIANLSQFVPINFATGSTNLVDAAIAKVIDTSLVSSTILGIGAPTGIASAIIGNAVQKNGRTTGYTTGSITSLNGTVSVSYPSGTATFIRQIITTSMSSAGDSGSVVLDFSNRVIGLLFAGSTSITILNDIRNVLSSFRSRLA